MEDLIASVADIYFDIEFQLANQVGCQPLPFPGMDSTVRILLVIIIDSFDNLTPVFYNSII